MLPAAWCGANSTHIDDGFSHITIKESAQTYNLGYRLWVGNQWEYDNGYVNVDEMVYYYNNLCDIIDNEIDALNDDDFKVSTISCAIHSIPLSLNLYQFVFKLEYGKINCNHNNGE